MKRAVSIKEALKLQYLSEGDVDKLKRLIERARAEDFLIDLKGVLLSRSPSNIIINNLDVFTDSVDAKMLSIIKYNNDIEECRTNAYPIDKTLIEFKPIGDTSMKDYLSSLDEEALYEIKTPMDFIPAMLCMTFRPNIDVALGTNALEYGLSLSRRLYGKDVEKFKEFAKVYKEYNHFTHYGVESATLTLRDNDIYLDGEYFCTIQDSLTSLPLIPFAFGSEHIKKEKIWMTFITDLSKTVASSRVPGVRLSDIVRRKSE